jgi:hypothetical protein
VTLATVAGKLDVIGEEYSAITGEETCNIIASMVEREGKVIEARGRPSFDWLFLIVFIFFH